jgi:diaminopimelate epimerase
MSTSGRIIPLVKAHAFGNDFLLAAREAVAAESDLSDLTRRACDRHRGIGADGLMVVQDTAAGARTRLFNADGGEAELSGNGVRCAAAWIAGRRSMTRGQWIEIETAAGPRRLQLLQSNGVRHTLKADMGLPSGLRRETLNVGGETIDMVVLNMGNPQCVVLGPATESRLHGVGAALAVHPAFPAGTNVELATVEAPDRVRILIWERDVGPTESSGTGSCAAAVAAAFAGGASRSVDVIAPGGAQHVEWTDEAVWLTGWAELIGDVNWIVS